MTIKTLFYTVFDAAHRPYQLKRHSICTDPKTDSLIYQETDDAYAMTVTRSRSGAYIFMTVASATTSEVRYLAAGTPMGALQVIHPRQHGLEYYVEHLGDQFLIRMNEGAENFQLMAASIVDPQKANWQVIVPHRGDTFLEDVHAFADCLVLEERRGGLKQLRLSAPDGLNNVRYVVFPEPDYSVRLENNPEFEANSLRFVYTSLVTPLQTVIMELPKVHGLSKNDRKSRAAMMQTFMKRNEFLLRLLMAPSCQFRSLIPSNLIEA